MFESYLVELGMMVSRLEQKLKLKPITAEERKHYLENHYGDSFIKDLYKHHAMLVEGKGDDIIQPDIIDYDGGKGPETDQRQMKYNDLVSN